MNLNSHIEFKMIRDADALGTYSLLPITESTSFERRVKSEELIVKK